MNNKGLLLVYNPHNLLEFFWYYCTDKEAKSKEWDALCLPNGIKGELMSGYCKKCGIFKNVYSDDKAFSESSSKSQLSLFVKMFVNFITGRRKSFCRKTLNEYVDIDSYGETVVLSDFGLLSGFAMLLDKKTVILEDGVGDYAVRSRKIFLQNLKNPLHWKGFIVSVMGYSNFSFVYPLASTKRCIKYSSHPEMMKYTDYKEIHRLFDFSETDMTLYDEILRRTYEELNNYDFSSVDTVYFSTNLGDFAKDTDEYCKTIEKYFSENAESVLIKKHPRDQAVYDIPGIRVTEMDQTMPAEVLLPYLIGKKIVFIFASSILLYMNAKDFEVQCLYLEKLHEDSVSQISHATYCDMDGTKEMFEKYGADDVKYIRI